MKHSWWVERLEAARARVIEYEEAILQISSGAVQSYSLNTGQTTQTVTKFDLDRLQATLTGLLNQVATLEARVHGCGVVNAGPAW